MRLSTHSLQTRAAKNRSTASRKGFFSVKTTLATDPYTQVILEPSSFTDEKFALYQSYQRNIHHEEDKMPSSFRNFLVDTPLLVSGFSCLFAYGPH